MSGCLIKNQEFIKDCFDKGFYFADKFGNVWSWKQPYKGFRKSPKKLKGGLNQGYLRVILCNSNKRLSVSVHVIIYLYYNRTSFQSTMHVNHINGNKKDNRLENLELLHYTQNAAHASSKNLYRTGKSHPKWAAVRSQTEEIVRLRSLKIPVRLIAKQFKTSPSTVSRIVREKGIKNGRKNTTVRNSKGRFI